MFADARAQVRACVRVKETRPREQQKPASESARVGLAVPSCRAAATRAHTHIFLNDN